MTFGEHLGENLNAPFPEYLSRIPRGTAGARISYGIFRPHAKVRRYLLRKQTTSKYMMRIQIAIQLLVCGQVHNKKKSVVVAPILFD